MWSGTERLIVRGYGRNFPEGKIINNFQSAIGVSDLQDQDNSFSPFLPLEIEAITKKLKLKKATGSDGITRIVSKMLTILFNNVMIISSTPEDWKYSNIIFLFKKGSRHQIENYRPISLSSTISKIFSKVIELRIRKILDFNQPPEQAGFRQNYSTIDHLHTLNQIFEKTSDYDQFTWLL